MLGTVGTFSSGSSEGIPTEYIAIFLAVLFPGALVALNYELLEELQPFTALRVYCAGVWHNAVVCLLCIMIVIFIFICNYLGIVLFIETLLSKIS